MLYVLLVVCAIALLCGQRPNGQKLYHTSICSDVFLQLFPHCSDSARGLFVDACVTDVTVLNWDSLPVGSVINPNFVWKRLVERVQAGSSFDFLAFTRILRMLLRNGWDVIKLPVICSRATLEALTAAFYMCKDDPRCRADPNCIFFSERKTSLLEVVVLKSASFQAFEQALKLSSDSVLNSVMTLDMKSPKRTILFCVLTVSMHSSYFKYLKALLHPDVMRNDGTGLVLTGFFASFSGARTAYDFIQYKISNLCMRIALFNSRLNGHGYRTRRYMTQNDAIQLYRLDAQLQEYYTASSLVSEAHTRVSKFQKDLRMMFSIATSSYFNVTVLQDLCCSYTFQPISPLSLEENVMQPAQKRRKLN